MPTSLHSVPVAFLGIEGTQQSELAHAWQAVIARGGNPVLVSPSPQEIQLLCRADPAEIMNVDVQLDQAQATDYAGLVVPGGLDDPDQLRTILGAIGFVRGFFEAGLPVAVIRHASWLLMEAGVVKGRRLTSSARLRAGLRNAGAVWVNHRVVVCENGPNMLVTSRGRRDLPVFCDVFTKRFAGCA